MSVSRDLTFACTRIAWGVNAQASGRHIVCYCRDCQSFARHLRQGVMLDAHGGTHIFQTVPHDVHLLRGIDQLRALRLSETGLFRWDAGCCHTPIANTLTMPDWPFVGLILPPDTRAFGLVAAQCFTKSAEGEVPAHGLVTTGVSLMWRALAARGTGKSASPFFDPERRPVVSPEVLTPQERKAARHTRF